MLYFSPDYYTNEKNVDRISFSTKIKYKYNFIFIKIVQTKNLTERFETRTCTFQTVVGILGQPTFTTHESMFRYDLDSKKNITATALLDAIQYNHN